MKKKQTEVWIKKQQLDIYTVIQTAIRQTGDPKSEYWIRRLFSFYSFRFRQLTQSGWVELLGKFTNEMAWGTYTDAKAREYCVRVRDAATKTMEERNNGEQEDRRTGNYVAEPLCRWG